MRMSRGRRWAVAPRRTEEAGRPKALVRAGCAGLGVAALARAASALRRVVPAGSRPGDIAGAPRLERSAGAGPPSPSIENRVTGRFPAIVRAARDPRVIADSGPLQTPSPARLDGTPGCRRGASRRAPRGCSRAVRRRRCLCAPADPRPCRSRPCRNHPSRLGDPHGGASPRTVRGDHEVVHAVDLLSSRSSP